MIGEAHIIIEAEVKPLQSAELLRGTWIVIIHVGRVPPHVGLLTEGVYNSLTIKGHELDVSLEALLKTISQRKIESAFVKLVPHPVFSGDYQNETFKEFIKQFPAVKQNEATCLSPLKLFLQEFYAIGNDKEALLYELMQDLAENKYIKYISGMNYLIPATGLELPFYTKEQLQERIKHERSAFYKD